MGRSSAILMSSVLSSIFNSLVRNAILNSHDDFLQLSAHERFFESIPYCPYFYINIEVEVCTLLIFAFFESSIYQTLLCHPEANQLLLAIVERDAMLWIVGLRGINTMLTSRLLGWNEGIEEWKGMGVEKRCALS